MKKCFLIALLLLASQDIFAKRFLSKPACWQHAQAEICYTPMPDYSMEYWDIQNTSDSSLPTLVVTGAGGPGYGFVHPDIEYLAASNSEWKFSRLLVINLAGTGENFDLPCTQFNSCMTDPNSWALLTSWGNAQDIVEILHRTGISENYYLYGVSYSGRTAAATVLYTTLQPEGIIYDSPVPLTSSYSRQGYHLDQADFVAACEEIAECTAQHPDYKQALTTYFTTPPNQVESLGFPLGAKDLINNFSFQTGSNETLILDFVTSFNTAVSENDLGFAARWAPENFERTDFFPIAVNEMINVSQRVIDELALWPNSCNETFPVPYKTCQRIVENLAGWGILPVEEYDLKRLAKIPAWLYRHRFDTQISPGAVQAVEAQHKRIESKVYPGVGHGDLLLEVLTGFEVAKAKWWQFTK